MRTQRPAIAAITVTILALACSGRGDVDLSKAKPLTAEPVATGPGAGVDSNGQYPVSSLFSLPPGSWTSYRVLGGVVDSVGTTLEQDFDGDGISNDKEATSNIWISDYPVIESEIAPPITMQVEILKTDKSDSSTINTSLNSDNFESRKDQGSEKFHQDEVNVKTINNGSTTATNSSNNTSTNTSEVKAEASAGFFDIDVSVSAGSSSTSTTNTSSSNTTVRQTYEDRPFVNNIDRAALSTKSDSAEKKARDYRQEKRSRSEQHYETTPNGGIVRAALYIKNQSINMPVKLTNILCSLVFETTSGALIPMQSFRLRNDDYSLFSVEVYGNSEFGPYVVELKNLNTVEVENALALGYTPKIFVVDYTMTHVQDSNYRQALSSNFTGDNLKIIEENAKGRTALLKLIYPKYRNMFRIVAYDSSLKSANGNICNYKDIDVSSDKAISPGIPMYRFLQRLGCSGIDIQFGHYIYDFTGTKFVGKYPKVYTYTVKSVNNVEVAAPCTSYASGTGFNPATKTFMTIENVCVIRVKDLTEDQLNGLSVWATFNNGKIYAPSEVAKDAQGNKISFDGVNLAGCGQPGSTGQSAQSGQLCGIPTLKGMTSMVWVGDNYDLVYMRMTDYLASFRKFGTNPLETGASMAFNTKWDLDSVGAFPYDPEVRSAFLGQAALGDTVAITFNLKDTTFLNPNFGPNIDDSTNLTFNQFSYNRKKVTQKFELEQAIDFELSMGLGGKATDWQNIRRPPSGSENIQFVSGTLDYLNQVFTVTIRLPGTHHLVPANGAVNLFLRPAMSNAYRNVIWPQDYQLVKKYDAKLREDVSSGNIVRINGGLGNISDIVANSDSIKIVSGSGISSYGFSSIVQNGAGFDITLSTDVTASHKNGDRIYVDASLGAPLVSMTIDSASASDNTFANYNAAFSLQRLLVNNGPIDCASSFAPAYCNGYSSSSPFNYVVNNWVGNESILNNWTDASRYFSFANNYTTPFALLSANSRNWSIKGLPTASQFSVANDILANYYDTGAQSLPQISKGNGKALITWYNGAGEMRGRVMNLPSGNFTTATDFLITSTNPYQSTPQIAIYGQKALVVYAVSYIVGIIPSGFGDEAVLGYNLWGQFIDLTTSSRTGSPFMIASNALGASMSLSGNRAVIAYGGNISALYSTDYKGARARIVDMGNGSFVGSEMILSNSSTERVSGAQVYAGTNVAFTAFQTYSGRIICRYVDLQTISPIGGATFSPGTTSSQYDYYPSVAGSGESAIVAWKAYTGSNAISLARVLDLQLMAVPSGSDLVLSPLGNSSSVSNLMATAENGKGLFTWSLYNGAYTATEIRGRVISLQSGSFLTPNDFLISTTNDTMNSPVKVSLSGNRGLVVWNHGASGNPITILGQTVDMQIGDRVSNQQEFTVNSTILDTIPTPAVSLIGESGVVAWEAKNNIGHTNIRSSIVTVPASYGVPSAQLPYGPNNFFTAPLIERNFMVTASIQQ